MDSKPIAFIHDRHGDPNDLAGFKPMAGFDPDELIGRTFLKPPKDNGERFRARILRKVIDCRDETTNDRIKYVVGCDNDKADEIMTYNDIVDSIESDMLQSNDPDDPERAWKFRKILGHQGPLSHKDKKYNGSLYNVLVEWESGETTHEPVDLLARDDPTTLAVYAKENGLINTPG